MIVLQHFTLHIYTTRALAKTTSTALRAWLPRTNHLFPETAAQSKDTVMTRVSLNHSSPACTPVLTFSDMRASVDHANGSSRSRYTASTTSSTSQRRREESLEAARRDVTSAKYYHDHNRGDSRPSASSTQDTVVQAGSQLDVSSMVSGGHRREYRLSGSTARGEEVIRTALGRKESGNLGDERRHVSEEVACSLEKADTLLGKQLRRQPAAA